MLDRIKKFLNNKNEKAFFVIAFTVFCLMLTSILKTIDDTDLYYFISNGEYILNNGIPYTNPFITTPNVPIVLQNWLYCVLCALANRFGEVGIIILHTIFVLGVVAIVFYFIRDVKSWAFKLLYFFIFAYCFKFWTIRPQMLTFILCMLEAIGIEKYDATENKKWLLFIPLTILVEINVHASYWIMHYIIILPYVVPFFKDVTENKNIKGKKKLLNILLFAGIGVVMLFINPYGVNSITYVFNALTSSTFDIVTNIGEQQSAAMSSLFGILIIIMIVWFVIALCNKKIDSVTFWMFSGFTLLVILKLKFFSFFGLGVLYMLRCFKNPSKLKVQNGVAILIVIVALICKSDIFSFNVTDTEFEHLEEMGEYLDEHEDKNVSVIASFQLENYFEYKGYKVYYDARPELYTEDILKTVNRFYALDGSTSSQRKELYDEIEIDYAVVTTNSQVYEDLENNENYTFILENEYFAMFRKDD